MTKDQDYISITSAANILGKPRSFVKRAIEKGLVRSIEVPFQSNLAPGKSSITRMVRADDIRDAVSGRLDLSQLDEVRTVQRNSLPANMTEFAERFTCLEQTVEQTGIMVAALMDRLDSSNNQTPAKPKKEIPDTTKYAQN
jgi:hypothetical protein